MPKFSLGTRFALIIVLGSLSTVAAIMAVAFSALVDDFETLLTQQQLSETRRIASEVEQRLQLKLDVLAESARMMSDGQSLHSLPEIQYLLDRQSLLSSLFPDGVLVLNAEATAVAENQYAPGRIGTNYADRQHFRQAIRTREPIISRPIMGRVTGVPLLSFVTPIESDENDLLGLMAGTVNIGQTSLIPLDRLTRLRDQDDTFKVVDINNYLYIEGGPASGARVQPLPAPGADPLVDAALSGTTFGTVTDSTGEELIYAASHLENLGWMFVRAVPYERATAPAKNSFMKFLGISVVVGLVIAALSFLAIRSTIKPLNKMTQTIEKMARNPSRGQRLIAAGSIETRQLANAFNQLMTERDVISKMKEEFVSNVSHELRTPLTSINGALRLLASGAAGELPQKAEEMAKLALRNGDRLQLLISDLLDFGKLAAGRMSINLSAQPILPIIKTAIESNASVAHERGLSLEIEGSDNPVVLADAHRLRQVLDNFISNAIKFSPPDLAISIRTTQSRPGFTSIIVHDHGTGVPELFEPKLFERFSQANSGSAKSVTGTGLGLAICRELATLMNGETGYFYDQGANFWIELPNAVLENHCR